MSSMFNMIDQNSCALFDMAATCPRTGTKSKVRVDWSSKSKVSVHSIHSWKTWRKHGGHLFQNADLQKLRLRLWRMVVKTYKNLSLSLYIYKYSSHHQQTWRVTPNPSTKFCFFPTKHIIQTFKRLQHSVLCRRTPALWHSCVLTKHKGPFRSSSRHLGRHTA